LSKIPDFLNFLLLTCYIPNRGQGEGRGEYEISVKSMNTIDRLTSHFGKFQLVFLATGCWIHFTVCMVTILCSWTLTIDYIYRM